MLDIRKLQLVKATNTQIESIKLIYYDLEKHYNLDLFAKPNNIRIYIGDDSYVKITEIGKIELSLHAIHKDRIMKRLSEKTLALIKSDKIKKLANKKE